MDFPVFDSVFIYLRRKNVLSEIFKKVFSCFLKFFKKSVDKCYENEYNNFCSREIWLINKEIEAWLSLVERCVRDAEVASSNLVASTPGPDGQAVKTTPSHGVNPGSIPGQVTI